MFTRQDPIKLKGEGAAETNRVAENETTGLLRGLSRNVHEFFTVGAAPGAGAQVRVSWIYGADTDSKTSDTGDFERL